MISSISGRTTVSATQASRSIQVAVRGLKQALATVNASLTVQEGLYRAYTSHLCDLDPIDEMPSPLQAAIHELLVDLRGAFGFDETTGAKVTPSTLDGRCARQLLARLEVLMSSAETMAAGTRPHSLS